MTRILMIMTTCDSEENAHTLSHGIIEQRLAACVQVSAPIRSEYRWEGKVEVSTEWRVIIKAHDKSKERVLSFIKDNHTYDLPQLIVIEGSASEDYVSWLTESIQD